MLDIQFILKNRDIVREAIKNKQKGEVDFDLIENLYKKRSQLIQEIEKLNQEKKNAADSRDEEKGRSIKVSLKTKEEELRDTTLKLKKIVSGIPNVPLPDVPIGKNEDDNVVIRKFSEPKDFDFKPRAHWDLGVELDLIDIERGVKVAGSRFSFLKGDIVRLQFALIQFVLSVVSDVDRLKEIAKNANLDIKISPFIPILPPVMIKPDVYFGMARLDPKEDKFYLEKDDLYLIGSAEHTLGSMHAGETFEESDLPRRYVGFSTAFRREAGSYGKDTKGILRQHQFDKLEFESFTVAEDSKLEQDFLIALQEYFLQQLNLPYQVIAVCTGDMGGPDLRQIDLEVWMPGQGVYRETHSADLMGEYQSRRLGIKVKREKGKEFVHMNDATVFAMGRTLVAIIENYQTKEGTIIVPEVLREYVNFDKIV